MPRKHLLAGAQVVTIKDVPIVRVGTWNASTGVSTIKPEDLDDMIAAATDPDIDEAVLKLGHTDPINLLKDGAPALGHFSNLKTELRKYTDPADNVEKEALFLVGDLEDVPKPLAQVIPHAYKRRSAEIAWGVRTAGGNTYRAALTGVALLGKFAPAVKGLGEIETIEDLYELYGVEEPEVEVESGANFAASSTSSLAQGDEAEAITIETSELADPVNLDAVREAWRDAHPFDPEEPGTDTWVREVWLTPGEAGGFLIIEGGSDLDNDELLRATWSIGDDGKVALGKPETVKVTYAPAQLRARASIRGDLAAKKIERETARTLLAAIPAENPPVSADPSDNGGDKRETPDQEAHGMTTEKRLQELLSIEDDAEATKALEALRTEAKSEGGDGGEGSGDGSGNGDGNDGEAKPDAGGDGGNGEPKPVETPTAPEGQPATANLSEGAVAQLRKDAEDGKEARAILRKQEIEAELRTALSQGRITPADVNDREEENEKGEKVKRVGWRTALERDFDGTKTLLSGLTPAYSTTEVGDDLAQDTASDSAYAEAFDSFEKSVFGADFAEEVK